MKSALIITPTTGAPDLADAVRSVLGQTYENTEHLIVVDGPQFSKATTEVLKSAKIKSKKIHRVDLPFNTGGNGFYGHRVMAAFGHLIEHDYVLFLDQDNWFDSDHVSSLVTSCEEQNLDWAYSLRKIYDKGKNFVCNDNCESLGKWEIAVSPGNHLIDSSSYCFRSGFYSTVSHLWDFGWGADRRFYTILKDVVKHTNYGCSGQHTLNYRLGGNEGSVTAEFFSQGNAITAQKYSGKYPWISA